MALRSYAREETMPQCSEPTCTERSRRVEERALIVTDSTTDIPSRFRYRALVILNNLGPTTGAHLGPGTLGMSFYVVYTGGRMSYESDRDPH